MTISINESRFNRAVQVVNRAFKIPYKNRLRCGPGRAILRRMNGLREQGFEFHTALAQAAAAQKGVGGVRKALYRRAVALYGLWTRRALEKKRDAGRVA